MHHDDADDEYDDEFDDDLEEIELPPLLQAAVSLHEVYTALTDAGFDEYDALRLIGFIITDRDLA